MAVRECLELNDYSGVAYKNASLVDGWAGTYGGNATLITLFTDPGSGDSKTVSGNYGYVNLSQNVTWTNLREFTTIDTSNLPADAVITAARIKIWGRTFQADPCEAEDTDFFFHLVEGNHASPPVLADWGKLDGQDTQGITISGNDCANYSLTYSYEYPLFTLDATTRAWITIGSQTEFGIRCYLDITDTSPDTIKTSGIYHRYNRVNWAEASTPAELGTSSTSISVSSTVYGSWPNYLEVTYTSATEASDAPRPRYRFEYKLSSADDYTACDWQYNKVFEDTITQAITGLLPYSQYRFRVVSENENALVHNSSFKNIYTDRAPEASSEKELTLQHRPPGLTTQPREYDLTLKKRHSDLTLQEREDELNLKKRYSSFTLKD